jgi:hypothetical protein
MAGTILERELGETAHARVKFDLASTSDDAEIRRLLRENPMRGQIALSLEREPDYFADAGISGEVKQTVVAHDGQRVAAVGACTIRERFVNGRPARVGYLGGLRLDAPYEGRFDILRRGYDFFRELQTEAPADYYFTSIASDNQRARNFLERGVRGMPLYEFIGEFVTLVISTRGRALAKTAAQSDRRIRQRSGGWPGDPLVEFLNRANAAFQFSPCWTAQDLSALTQLGLSESDFYLSFEGERITVCGALWDQRSFKQTVVRDYAPALAFPRPALNAVSSITGQPRMPRVGEILANAFVSHLSVERDDGVSPDGMLAELAAMARGRGIELLTLGFAANDPRLHSVCDQFRCRKYRSRIYVVRWPGIGGSAREMDGRHLNPEAALL